MPILPNRIQKNGSTLNAQISPSDEPLYSPLPIHAAARLLPTGRWGAEGLECGQTFDGVFTEKPALQSSPASSSINTSASL